MSSPNESPSGDANLPHYAEDSVRSIAEFRVEHAREASFLERTIEQVTRAFGRPLFVVAIVSFVAAWTALNGFARQLHVTQFDPPPFYWLQGLVSVTALCTTALILTTQRRLDRLAEDRAQLTLQIALVGEQKTTKIIALLEELRVDHPEMPNRHDPEAVAMSEPANPRSVLDALRERQSELEFPVDDASSEAVRQAR